MEGFHVLKEPSFPSEPQQKPFMSDSAAVSRHPGVGQPYAVVRGEAVAVVSPGAAAGRECEPRLHQELGQFHLLLHQQGWSHGA